MDIEINYDEITRILSAAHVSGRSFLYEYEVYSLLAWSGSETPPKCRMITKENRITEEALAAVPGEKTVLKIVSPHIVHKTEVGGVMIVDRQINTIRSAVRRMLYEVPEKYAAWIRQTPDAVPEPYQGLHGDALVAAVSREIKGVLHVQFMPPDSGAFGNELIVGLRHTREFGTIISAGLGGTDTELFAKRFRKGQAIVAASVEMIDGEAFFQLFKQTISYRKLAGLTRGQRRIVTDEQIVECFESFIRMGRYYSRHNPDTPFVIQELEINPFSFSDYLMVPLDGLCRFCRPGSLPTPRPVQKIDRLLHPESIGIIGVSSKRKNFGRIILDNILSEGFDPDNIVIFKEGETRIDHIRCLKDLTSFKQEKNRKLDLLIVAVAASLVPDIVDDLIQLDIAQTVMLIPGGMGETDESRDRAQRVIQKIDRVHLESEDGGPVFLGANCMGVISRPGGYDTWFIPEEKLPKARHDTFQRAALVSQSGAFMLHRSHQYPLIRPAYMISMGNQTDLTLGDMVHYFKTSSHVDVIAVYAEGFKDLDGLKFCKNIRDAVLSGKEVVFYKAGRTTEGKAATSSHTASLAGDYMVCESCVRQAGAMVARTFSEFQELLFLAESLHGKHINGNRLAAVSGAGFEAVGMADSIQSDDFCMALATLGDATKDKLSEVVKTKRLEQLVSIANPLDINPAADDETHAVIVDILTQDDGVDAVIVSLDPLSPAMKTLDVTDVPAFDMHHETGILNRLVDLAQSCNKPVVAVVDGGRLYNPLRDALMKKSIPVFTTCDRAVACLALYLQGRLNSAAIRSNEE